MSSDGYTLKWLPEKAKVRVEKKLWRLAERVLVEGTPEERDWLRIQMAQFRESRAVRYEEIDRMKAMFERFGI